MPSTIDPLESEYRLDESKAKKYVGKRVEFKLFDTSSHGIPHTSVIRCCTCYEADDDTENLVLNGIVREFGNITRRLSIEANCRHCGGDIKVRYPHTEVRIVGFPMGWSWWRLWNG